MTAIATGSTEDEKEEQEEIKQEGTITKTCSGSIVVIKNQISPLIRRRQDPFW